MEFLKNPEFKIEIKNISALDIEAKKVLKQYKSIKTWALEGPLGSGKTTFVKAICKAIDENLHPHSPTFPIVNTYQGGHGTVVHHMDLYRIKNPASLKEIGLIDYLSSGNYCFIEWPSIGIPYLLPPFLWIKFIEMPQSRTLLGHLIAQ